LDSDDSFSSELISDLDVSVVSPVGTPGVSDVVESSSEESLALVSGGSDSVVELAEAILAVEDTFMVELEILGGSINGDSNWSLSDGALEEVSEVWPNFVDLINENFAVNIISAYSILGSVLVVGFSGQTILGSVLHGKLLPSTIATVTLLVTVNQLLLRKILEISVS